jgi:hypothetical protein
MRTLDLREIPAVYLNLKMHTEKNKSMQKMLKECGFKKIIRVEGVLISDNPPAGCSAAHYNGLREIKPPFILFEDDCVIKNFKPIIEIPEDADAVYLGVSCWGREKGETTRQLIFEKINEDLYRIYNMLATHAILYLTKQYVEICQRIVYHAAYIIESFPDIGIAEVQKLFNVYVFDDPFFYQDSSLTATNEKLTFYLDDYLNN